MSIPLAVITLPLPLLRDRREDLPLLAEQFLAKINREFEQLPAQADGGASRTASTSTSS